MAGVMRLVSASLRPILVLIQNQMGSSLDIQRWDCEGETGAFPVECPF